MLDGYKQGMKHKIPKQKMANMKQPEPTSGNKKIGSMGEKAACTYLESKGHIVLARNLRLKRGEIDILTVRNNTLHLVEVKTGVSVDAIVPEDSF
jgi:uncharacterized protein UPF0102